MRSVGNERHSRLLGLMTSQYNFGAIAGAPVLFYLGAFIYTILDLNNDRSDEGATISLVFEVEWMITVHVSIIAACVLASNNTSTTSVLVGLPPLKTFHRMRRVSTKDALAGKPHTGPTTFRAHRLMWSSCCSIRGWTWELISRMSGRHFT